MSIVLGGLDAVVAMDLMCSVLKNRLSTQSQCTLIHVDKLLTNRIRGILLVWSPAGCQTYCTQACRVLLQSFWCWYDKLSRLAWSSSLNGHLHFVFRDSVYLQICLRGRWAGIRRTDGMWSACMDQAACLLLIRLRSQASRARLAFARVLADPFLQFLLYWPALYVF